MKNSKGIIYTLIGIVVLVGIVFGIHTLTGNTSSAKSATITVGSQGSDYDIWNHIADSKQAKSLA